MIIGIGTDMVEIARIARYIESSPAFFRDTFTPAEQLAGENAPDRADWFAARFAAKEAVFKSIAHRTRGGFFDLRTVETLNHPDGAPYVHITDALRPTLDETGVAHIHISITTEGGFAVAFVVAEG